MKISYSWLKDYLDIDLPAEEVSEILTDIGLEVEGVDEHKGPGNGLEGLVVGHIKEVTKHPDADRLNVTQVDLGDDELHQIVCGAPNVAVGQKVVVATVGATLYPEGHEPFSIKKSKIRGVASNGMICAEDEIGLGASHDGIMVLNEDAKLGEAVAKHFGFESDFIFDIDLTPNRSDAISHLGVARDLAAALSIRKGKKYKVAFPKVKQQEISGELSISVEVENSKSCPRYAGVVISNITVQPSPDHLKQKLESIGVRPINNIVDITNFILHEIGQPLHAFDYDEVKGSKIVVKHMPTGTKFMALDEKEYALNEADLMICNAEEPMCIAGVFGGLHSGVTDNTTIIFLESAYFDPISVRKSSHRHNLRTDAATRFEKGADPAVTIDALYRAIELIAEYGGGTVASELIDIYPETIEPFKVEISYKEVRRLIGHKIPKKTIKTILKRLDIAIEEESDKKLKLSVPPYRADVKRSVDVIEEILRIYGLNNIPMPKQLRASLSHTDARNKQGLYENVANYLAASGFYEMMTNSLTHQAKQDKLFPDQADDTVTLLKSSNAELNVLRHSMMPTGLEAVGYNINRSNSDLKLFDFGKVYRKAGENKYEEKEKIALFISGNKYKESWTTPTKSADLFYLKSIITNALNRIGLSRYQVRESEMKGLAYGLCFAQGKNELVNFGLVDKAFCKVYDIKQDVFYAELNWEMILRTALKAEIRYKQVSKFPGSRRDLALLVDKQVKFEQIATIAKKEGKQLLKEVNLFDVYQDKNLGDIRSYGVSFTFEDAEKTLTDKQIEPVMNKLVKRYTEELKAELR